MKPTPKGWPRISTSLYYDDPKAAIEWLCKAFGFEVRMLVEGDGGSVEHSELTYGGEGMVMVSGGPKGGKFTYRRTPSQIAGGNTQNLMLYVDDIEAHWKRAEAAGAKLTMPLETHDYGEDHWADRGYECADIGGHHWYFAQRLSSGKSA